MNIWNKWSPLCVEHNLNDDAVWSSDPLSDILSLNFHSVQVGKTGYYISFKTSRLHSVMCLEHKYHSTSIVPSDHENFVRKAEGDISLIYFVVMSSWHWIRYVDRDRMSHCHIYPCDLDWVMMVDVLCLMSYRKVLQCKMKYIGIVRL